MSQPKRTNCRSCGNFRYCCNDYFNNDICQNCYISSAVWPIAANGAHGAYGTNGGNCNNCGIWVKASINREGRGILVVKDNYMLLQCARHWYGYFCGICSIRKNTYLHTVNTYCLRFKNEYNESYPIVNDTIRQQQEYLDKINKAFK